MDAGTSPPDGDVVHVELLPQGGPLRPLLKLIGYAEQAVAGSLILVILVLVLIQVTQRYAPFDVGPWTGEVARLSLVWCTFILAGYLMAEDRHITIKLVDLVLRERALGFVKLVSHVVVVATCLGMGYGAYRLIADDIGQRTPAAGIPIGVVYVIPLIGFLLTALRGVMAIGLVDIHELRRGRKPA
jgi:TRAP-type C4-dicarboxylate transport system permease small subunit